jgi:O-antigen/teichoic acid export membrane protein
MSAEPYWAAGRLVPIVVCAFLFYASTRVFHGGLLVTGCTAALSWLTAIGLVVNTAANLALIPPFGAMGAAWAALITHVILAAITLWASQRVFPVEYEWKRTLLPVALACALVIAGLPWGADRLGLAVAVHTALFVVFLISLLILPLFSADEKAALWRGVAAPFGISTLRTWPRNKMS